MTLAKTSKRIGAYLLDILFVFLLVNLISSIKFINPNYDKYNEAYQNYQELITKNLSEEKVNIDEFTEISKEYSYELTKYGISYNIVTIIVLIGYFGLFQKYNNGQTLGKKIMKIKVVSDDETELSLIKCLLRTILVHYILVGNIIYLIVTSIVVNFITMNTFATLASIVSYITMGIGIISLILVSTKENKKGLHDLIIKSKVVNE